MIKVELISGNDAAVLLDDEVFAAAWDSLFEACPWATPFQHREFARIWFKHYGNWAKPLFVINRSTSGQLDHLLALGICLGKGRLVAVGAHQAEYQAWISRHEGGSAFIINALRALGEHCGLKVFRFKFLPPELTEHLTSEDLFGNLPVMVRTEKMPLVLIDGEPAPTNSLQKKSNKSRLSKLSKMGPVKIELIQSEAITKPGAAAIIEKLRPFYDLRQAAAHGDSPFRNDNQKAGFYCDLLHKTRHFAVLNLIVGENTVAGLLGPIVKGRLSNAIIAHDPVLGRYSPGKFLILLGVGELGAVGLKGIDLTPQGKWKSRFTNHTETVAEVVVYVNRWRYRQAMLTAAVEKCAKRLLRFVDVTPSQAKAALAKMHTLSAAKVAAKIRACLTPKVPVVFRLYRYVASDAQALTIDDRFAQNRIDDFLAYDSSVSWQNRQAFLSSVQMRLENGVLGFSLAENDVLLHYGWMNTRQVLATFTEVGRSFTFPENSAVLYDYFTHPKARGQGLYQASIRTMLAAAAAIEGTEWIYIGVLADNGPSRHVIEKLGFEFVTALTPLPARISHGTDG